MREGEQTIPLSPRRAAAHRPRPLANTMLGVAQKSPSLCHRFSCTLLPDMSTSDSEAATAAATQRANMANEAYLSAHPELGELLDQFMSELLSAKPDNTLDFAVQYFTRKPEHDRSAGK
ncbi:hypothetical protein EON66_03870 [archaeon]|nr:MAG: hypothetical protein EON66_03870 [archaeon]